MSVPASATAFMKNQKHSHRPYHAVQISVPPPSFSGLFGRKLLEKGGSSSTGRQRQLNGHCVAGAGIAESLRECEVIVNESDEKLLL